ncbi:MAG: XdhC family protein, partial [Pseudomonadota bacterium]
EGDRSTSEMTEEGFRHGWMREDAEPTARPIWVWGAGHVGAALVRVLAPLPEVAVVWVDDAPERFPNITPEVEILVAADMPRAMVHAPASARHVIVTYSHDIDLALCHAALGRDFGSCGVIGSATKWARFRSRLAALGHSNDEIARIDCPIGDPALGKHPQAIAVGVAAGLLSTEARTSGAVGKVGA